jgi:hypothetical protein
VVLEFNSITSRLLVMHVDWCEWGKFNCLALGRGQSGSVRLR